VRGRADAARGAAACALSAAWLREPARCAEEVLDALVLFLLTARDRLPLHAAGVMIGDTALLLAGPSGSGKSTLALEAARGGFAVLSDDTVYLQRDPSCVWGFPRPIHVLPPVQSALGIGLRHRAGRWKQRVEHPAAGAPLCAERAILVLLERGTRVAITPLAPEAAAARLTAGLDPGFDRFAAALPPAVGALAARGGAWRLTLSADPAEGLEALRQLADPALQVARRLRGA
jgi:hypothetical protein